MDRVEDFVLIERLLNRLNAQLSGRFDPKPSGRKPPDV